MKILFDYFKRNSLIFFLVITLAVLIITIKSDKYIGNIYNLEFSIFIVYTSVTLVLLFRLNSKNTNEITLSDEKRLFDKKREYLDAILNTLKLNIDKDLQKSLESGDVEEANNLIEDKISALNKLVQTVKGDNSKSLRGTEISSVSEFYDSTSLRIRREINRIQNNAYGNIVIGVVASAFAIYVLYQTIQVHKIELIEIIPRATISILIEAFAFFFFSQYRKQQEEIKYWNNEKTNLDLKIFALSIAIDDEEIGTKDYMRSLITDFIKTERNFFGIAQIKDTKEEKQRETIDDKKLSDQVFSKIKELADLLPTK
ncbi:hypothetical protein [Emticicia fluvialis]|uniref:hypothetical protein n=1 Tax=Emticicia fluvialis TaxID=2974474 RepID=UPI002165CB54|nr:hypothetical protein [Emticicia fluvialis]